MPITIRTEDSNPGAITDRIRQAREHVDRHGTMRGETRREAICHLACLTSSEEYAADVAGLLPPDPV